jgi:enamine deaminase RidA (YjgF/YER057c/UK114 family)
MQQGKNTFINPTTLFNPVQNGFSHIGKAPANAEIVFVSGQWASDLAGKLVSTDFEQQVRQTFKNVKIALQASNLAFEDIIKLTIYIAEFEPIKKDILIKVAIDEWDAEFFPASTIVPLPMLATYPGTLIEIEAIATK